MSAAKKKVLTETQSRVKDSQTGVIGNSPRRTAVESLRVSCFQQKAAYACGGLIQEETEDGGEDPRKREGTAWTWQIHSDQVQYKGKNREKVSICICVLRSHSRISRPALLSRVLLTTWNNGILPAPGPAGLPGLLQDSQSYRVHTEEDHSAHTFPFRWDG
jgi:hypothetical protein